MNFKSSEHEETYKKFCQNCFPDDRERKAMFYILSGCRKFIDNIHKIYDFKRGKLAFLPGELPEGLMFSSSEKALFKLACNLYNSSYESMSVNDTFRNLDPDNYKLVIESLRIRFEPEA